MHLAVLLIYTAGMLAVVILAWAAHDTPRGADGEQAQQQEEAA